MERIPELTEEQRSAIVGSVAMMMLGHLTTREQSVTMGARENCSMVPEIYTEFMQQFGLNPNTEVDFDWIKSTETMTERELRFLQAPCLTTPIARGAPMERRYTRLANHYIRTEGYNDEIAVMAIAQQFCPMTATSDISDLLSYIRGKAEPHVLAFTKDQGEYSFGVCRMYAMPIVQVSGSDFSEMSFAEAMFINRPWWDPEVIRVHPQLGLIWTDDEANEYTVVGDVHHVRYSAGDLVLRDLPTAFTKGD